MKRLEKITLNLKWLFFYRGVLVAPPNAGQMLMFDKMHRAVAMHKCAVCKKQYWVVGNPKVKGHFSPVCGRRQCYLTFYGDWKGNPANKPKPHKLEIPVAINKGRRQINEQQAT